MEKFKKYLPFTLVIGSILLLWLLRWESLKLPYFWDEMGVYGNGVQYLISHEIGILPEVLPADISRGHPLLFFTIHALVIQFFGNEFFVSHVFSLLVSSLTLVSTYLLAKEFLPKILAAGCVVLLLSQNIFLAQSSLVIPEMMIALVSTLAILNFVKKRYAWAILLLCFGVLIKESVILIAAFLGFVFLIKLIKNGSLRLEMAQLLSFSLPLVVLLSFLFIQKMQQGWYFFPYHTEILQDGAFSGFFEKLEMHYTFLFFKQGRNQWLIAGLLGLLSLGFSKNKQKLLFLLSFFIVNLLLFSFAFYMDRYILYLYPIIVILIVQGVYFLSLQRKFVSILLVLVLASLSFAQIQDSSFRYDASLAYEDVVLAHQEAISYFCELDEKNYDANFPINMSLWNSQLGYLNESCESSLIYDQLSPKYLILYNQEKENLEALYTAEVNEARVSIYQLE